MSINLIFWIVVQNSLYDQPFSKKWRLKYLFLFLVGAGCYVVRIAVLLFFYIFCKHKLETNADSDSARKS